MKWATLFLLLLLPIVTLVLNHDAVSAMLIIAWTIGVIPLCIVQALDFVRGNASGQSARLAKLLLRILLAIFGMISCLMGAGIVAWCLYNVAVKRLPQYSGPDAIGLALGGFGIAPTLLAFGWYLLNLSGRK